MESPTSWEITDARTLDLRSAAAVFHGNYQSVRSPKAVLKYLGKENDWITNDEEKVEEIKMAYSSMKRQKADEPSPWIDARKIATQEGDLRKALTVLEGTDQTVSSLGTFTLDITQELTNKDITIGNIRNTTQKTEFICHYKRVQELSNKMH
jgi:hypothetical protein